MKLTTWNVERLKKKKFLPEILSEIEKVDADILILIETDSQISPKNYPFEVKTKSLVLVDEFAKSTENRVSIFSKFPILNKFETYDEFTTVAVIAILMVIFSAVSILQVETAPESNIKTAEDALWWAYVTVTTVGYGDKYPVTTEGRIIAGALMTVGVGLFGTFTAFLASWFVEDKQEHMKD